MESALRLFKGVLIKSKRKKKAGAVLLKETIERGFVFAPELVFNYTEAELFDLVKLVERNIGLTTEKMNSSFHKSWAKVKDAPLLQLYMEQLCHYFTTYGFEALGVYDEGSVYIPNEKLDLPMSDCSRISLVVINGFTKAELKDKILKLIRSGIALGEQSIKDVVDVIDVVGLDDGEIASVKNKEVKVILYDQLKTFPEAPVEFLRYVVYRMTGKTLLIKDRQTILDISEDHHQEIEDVLYLFNVYRKKFGFERLAEIFYRFKLIFLAFKRGDRLCGYINRIRKLAKVYHKPMSEDYLNSITAMIKRGDKVDIKELKGALSRVNSFRKIRLAYALKFRTKDADSIMYRIRNGKGFATETTEYSIKQKKEAKKILDVVINSIVGDVGDKVRDKKIYIPSYITYSLPSTEKQFSGNFPSGTYISIPKNMIFGVHWENQKNTRVDLDLSMINVTVGKVGWDSSYRTDGGSVLFSGDITDAPKPNGACELFYVRKQCGEDFIVFVNNYTYCSLSEVLFEIFVASEELKGVYKNYMVNPNTVVSIVRSEITVPQKMLGLLSTTSKGCRFYFVESGLGNSITSGDSDFVNHARKYFMSFYKNMITLDSILKKAGGIIVRDKDGCDIDLSPENIDKAKILNLF